MISISKEEASKTKPFLQETPKRKSLLKKCLLIFLGIFIVVALIIGIVFIVIFATSPCTFKTCHANATCTNSPFKAKCKCNSGFNGNGIECDECGKAYPASKNLNNYGYDSVVYGDAHVMPAFSYPSTVLLRFQFYSMFRQGNKTFNPYYTTRCLGAIINRRTVITVGSCMPPNFNFTPRNYDRYPVMVPITLSEFYPTWSSMFSVWVGIHKYIYEDYDISPIQTFEVKNIIWHPKFDMSSFDFDVLVVQLKESIPLSQSVQIACIPTAEDLPSESKYLAYNTSGVSIGYELFRDKRNYRSLFLGDFDLNILHTNNCTGQFPFTPDPDQIFCAGNYHFLPPNKPPKNLAGVYCEGNIGSPFYINRTVNGNLRTFVVGLMSNSTMCGLAVFTNLFKYIDWIPEYTDY